MALFFFILFGSSTCIAELKDPTKPAHYSSVTASAKHSQTGDLNLSSIWISGQSRRATVNGIVAKQGDVILSDIKIIKIYNNAIKIKQNGMTRKLTLLTHSYKSK
jgi:hypothetical protein